MRFYNQPHAYYCGVDLHARSMFTHVVDQAEATVFASDLAANPQVFLAEPRTTQPRTIPAQTRKTPGVPFSRRGQIAVRPGPRDALAGHMFNDRPATKPESVSKNRAHRPRPGRRR